MRLRLSASHGPLALADEIGLDAVHRALESLRRELGLPQFRPAPLLRRMFPGAPGIAPDASGAD